MNSYYYPTMPWHGQYLSDPTFVDTAAPTSYTAYPIQPCYPTTTIYTPPKTADGFNNMVHPSTPVLGGATTILPTYVAPTYSVLGPGPYETTIYSVPMYPQYEASYPYTISTSTNYY